MKYGTLDIWDSGDNKKDPFRNVYTVSELSGNIKTVLENNFLNFWIEGEISNYKLHSSGHAYFTLKDEKAQIRCVMWRNFNASLRFKPEDGMKVLCFGDVTIYEPSGNYQIKIKQMQPAGMGALQMAFEQLKNRLAAEGLFDESHKKKLPEYPDVIGVVTSPTGAAVRDIISVIRRRAPQTKIILVPVNVQGPGAAEEIAAAIKLFNEYGAVDLLIVGRGGGSLEDLWPFNEEVVARAVYDSVLPVISAVGHQIDFTISDFVADLRAPTPSAAAELAVKDNEEVLKTVSALEDRIQNSLGNKIRFLKEKLRMLDNSYGFREPENIIAAKMQKVDELEQRITLGFGNLLERYIGKIESLKERLDVLNPKDILRRGYSMVYSDDKLVKSVSVLHKGDKVKMIFYDGDAKGIIDGLYPQSQKKTK